MNQTFKQGGLKRGGLHTVSLIDAVCMLQILGVVINMIFPQIIYDWLILDPVQVMRGQVWRILTFLIFPPMLMNTNGFAALNYVVFNGLSLYCIRIFGQMVERAWGRFKLNCYLISGVLLHAAASVVFFLLTGFKLMLFPTYFVFSFFFVFALMFPDIPLAFMMVFPLKARWLAVFEAAIYVYSFVTGSIIDKVEIFLCLLLIGIFLGWISLENGTMPFLKKAGYAQNKAAMGEKIIKAPVKMRVEKRVHRCAVCGRTSEDSPAMEFRYCSKCDGAYEYCSDHLYTHQHVKKEEQQENDQQS